MNKGIVGRFMIGPGGDSYEEVPKKSQAFLRGGKVALTRGKESGRQAPALRYKTWRAGYKFPRYDVKRSAEVYPRHMGGVQDPTLRHKT